MRNRLDSLARNTQRTFKELSAALNSDERQDALRTFNECTEAVHSADADQVQRALSNVERIAILLTNAMMSGAASPAKSGASNNKEAN
jgi:hypothetical protein